MLATTIEPAEAKALDLAYAAAAHVAGAEHPHAGFVRAAAEDGYRRLLRPMLSSELRTRLKADADAQAIDTFERSLRNLLLGPVGGPRKTLGIQPDVTAGHRTGAVDEQGRAIHAGRLPHEATAGREAAVAALKDLIEVHGIEVIAVGTSNGRRDALTLAEEAKKLSGREVTIAENGPTAARARSRRRRSAGRCGPRAGRRSPRSSPAPCPSRGASRTRSRSTYASTRSRSGSDRTSTTSTRAS